MKSILTKDCRVPERRKYQRVRKGIFLLCKPPNAEEPVECIAENIGGGGLMFETDKFFPVAIVLPMEIYLPVDLKTTVSIFTESKVVWIKKIESTKPYKGSNKYKVGAKFERIKKEDKEKILAFVRKSIRVS